MPVNEIMTDPDLGSIVINDSGLPMNEVMGAMSKEPALAALVKWTSQTQGSGSPERRRGSLWDRDRWITPSNPLQQMMMAYEAAENDDVVSTVVESTEALAFSKMGITTDDEDEEDIWNQIAADLDMDSRLREIWRELFVVSQCYMAVWWDRKSYKVSGKTEKGITRKKTFENLLVPTGITVLDPLKVIPVGNFLFNKEQLCYVADRTESDPIDSFLAGEPDAYDPVIANLIIAKYEPDFRERKQLGNLGVDVNRLYVMNPRAVFRLTATRPQYNRFASVRMKSVFEILDLKHQLRQMDRATLIGGTNFIILIKKGSDKLPAQPEEIANLQMQVRTVANVPILVGDHRLSVEIITPKQDHTLDAQKYAGLDMRIQARLYGTIMQQSTSGRSADDSIKVARVIARGLESRRLMMRRSIEANILDLCFKANDQFTAPAKLRFYPKRIALDFDPALASYLLDLFQNGALSRESILAEVDYDEAEEARKRQVEKDKYDKIFAPTVLPPGSPGAGPGAPAQPDAPADPKSAGRTRGGNRNGGGSARGTGQGQAPRNPAKPKTPKSKRPAAANEED